MGHKVLFNLLPALGLILAVGLVPGSQPSTVGAQGLQPQDALGSVFTYQGRLMKNGSAVNDTCAFRFSLWEAASGGNQVGNPQTVSDVIVDDGCFSVTLNGGGEFGSNAFTGAARYLQIAAKCSVDSNFVTLTGRVALNATPYALYAASAPWNGLRNVPAGFADNADDDTLTALSCGSGQMAKWDGMAWVCGPYLRTVIVSPVGTAAENGTALLDALAGITDATSNTPYLLKIEPGVYDLGANALVMKEYVDIEGSGELVTRITASNWTSLDNPVISTFAVVGADHAEMRFLTVENRGPETSAGDIHLAVIHNENASPRLTHVTVVANDPGSSYSILYGVINHFSSPTMTHVTITAAGGFFDTGVYNDSSSPVMTQVAVIARGAQGGTGVANVNNSSPIMKHVTIAVSGGEGSCGVCNDSSSPTMADVTITALGVAPVGVSNGSSSPTMTNVIVTSEGTFGTGIYNESSSPTMVNVTATVSGTESSRGVHNVASSPTIQNGTISASGGTLSGYGIYNEADSGSYTVKINNSQITSSRNTIVNDAEFTTRVGASQLAGTAVTGGGTVTCAGVYDENYAFYANTCP